MIERERRFFTAKQVGSPLFSPMTCETISDQALSLLWDEIAMLVLQFHRLSWLCSKIATRAGIAGYILVEYGGAVEYTRGELGALLVE